MNTTSQRVLLWLPRILSLSFAFFLGLFALDVFVAGGGFWDILLGFLIHLTPTFLLLLIVYFSWQREWIGAVCYFLLAMMYPVIAWGRFPLSTYLLISGPMVLVSGLFAMSWWSRKVSEKSG